MQFRLGVNKMSATNKRRVLTAISRIDNAIFHLDFLMKEKKGFNKKAIKWNIDSTLYDLKNAKTLLSNTTFKNKDR